MTENLLQKLEEKMMFLISELEEARKEIRALKDENSHLKVEKERHGRKLHDLLALLDALEIDTTLNNLTANPTLVKPMLVTSKDNISG